MIRPGPAYLPRGRAPGGIVVHVYSVPGGDLLSASILSASMGEEELQRVADRQADAAFGRGGAVCLVFYDGDSGERVLPPGMTTGEQL